MSKPEWLPLMDYSTKHGISISTLRRRIRSHSIDYRLDDGKYFIADVPLEKESPGRRPIEVPQPPIEPAPRPRVENKPTPQPLSALKTEMPFEPSTKDATNDSIKFFSAAHKLLDELKRAYTLILQEKEEQICQLKDEISDLRTLVRVLEAENERLRAADDHNGITI